MLLTKMIFCAFMPTNIKYRIVIFLIISKSSTAVEPMFDPVYD